MGWGWAGVKAIIRADLVSAVGSLTFGSSRMRFPFFTSYELDVMVRGCALRTCLPLRLSLLRK